jgi:hypothetical protein
MHRNIVMCVVFLVLPIWPFIQCTPFIFIYVIVTTSLLHIICGEWFVFFSFSCCWILKTLLNQAHMYPFQLIWTDITCAFWVVAYWIKDKVVLASWFYLLSTVNVMPFPSVVNLWYTLQVTLRLVAKFMLSGFVCEFDWICWGTRADNVAQSHQVQA